MERCTSAGRGRAPHGHGGVPQTAGAARTTRGSGGAAHVRPGARAGRPVTPTCRIPVDSSRAGAAGGARRPRRLRGARAGARRRPATRPGPGERGDRAARLHLGPARHRRCHHGPAKVGDRLTAGPTGPDFAIERAGDEVDRSLLHRTDDHSVEVEVTLIHSLGARVEDCGALTGSSTPVLAAAAWKPVTSPRKRGKNTPPPAPRQGSTAADHRTRLSRPAPTTGAGR